MASKKFEDTYIATGKVQLVFSEFPLNGHVNAMPAAEAARCAGTQSNNAFWQMHDILFNNQTVWGADQNTQARFESYAAHLGLDNAAFSSCIKDGTTRAAIEKARNAGIQLGVGGTPAFAVNGKLVENTPNSSVDDMVVQMMNVVDQALAGK